MVETALLTLGFGVAVFFVLVGFYEWRKPDRVVRIVMLSTGLGFLIQFLNGLVVDGTWGLVTMTVPEWVGKTDSAIMIAFLVFPGYVVWRWVPDSSTGLDTDEERRLYRYRWVFYALSVVMGGAFVLIFVFITLNSIGVY